MSILLYYILPLIVCLCVGPILKMPNAYDKAFYKYSEVPLKVYVLCFIVSIIPGLNLCFTGFICFHSLIVFIVYCLDGERDRNSLFGKTIPELLKGKSKDES